MVTGDSMEKQIEAAEEELKRLKKEKKLKEKEEKNKIKENLRKDAIDKFGSEPLVEFLYKEYFDYEHILAKFLPIKGDYLYYESCSDSDTYWFYGSLDKIISSLEDNMYGSYQRENSVKIINVKTGKSPKFKVVLDE